MSPFQEHGIDSSPVVRSFLLQLCLKCDKKLANEHIEAFMAHKKTLLDGEDEVVEFAQLYMNCVQDVILQRIYSSDTNIETVLTLKSIELLGNHMDEELENNFDIQSLDTFRNVKLALGQVVRVTAKYIDNPELVQQNRHMMRLMNLASQFLAKNRKCLREYFVRELCIKYRSDAVYEMKRNPFLLELLPTELVKDENPAPDLFHISGKQYQELKSKIVKGLIEDDFSELKDCLENNPDPHIVNVMLLATFNCYTCSMI